MQNFCRILKVPLYYDSTRWYLISFVCTSRSAMNTNCGECDEVVTDPSNADFRVLRYSCRIAICYEAKGFIWVRKLGVFSFWYIVLVNLPSSAQNQFHCELLGSQQITLCIVFLRMRRLFLSLPTHLFTRFCIITPMSWNMGRLWWSLIFLTFFMSRYHLAPITMSKLPGLLNYVSAKIMLSGMFQQELTFECLNRVD